MKQLLVIFLIGFMAIKALAQPSVDIGVFGGAGTYFGDMTKIDLQKSINPAYGGFIRFNFNPRYAIRFNVINGTIGAEGEYDYQPLNPNLTDLSWNFNKNVLDISLNFEWNYLKYIVGDKETHWSTFIFGGVGMQTFKYNIQTVNGIIDGSEISPTIPFGLGVKYTLSKRWGIGLEGGLRKSFSDKLDNLDDPLSYMNTSVTPNVQVKYTDQLHNNDWTSYMGIHLVYKLIYGTQNWELRTPRKNMIDWGIKNKNRKE
jgi:opacity protein-like surface antigen